MPRARAAAPGRALGDQRSNYIISVTSHHMGNERGTSYGPYWDESFVQLMD
jgi:hypothetical protein